MKLLASLLTAFCVACLAQALFMLAEKTSRPSKDFLTQALRRLAERLEARNIPWVARYVKHITPIINETPLPPTVDKTSFLAFHLLGGLPLWLMFALVYPHRALFLLPICFTAGLVLPYLWLKYQQAQFHVVLLKSLPECLELQALVMEAGLDFNAGIQHYLEKGTPSPLQTLLHGVQREIQMGRSRVEAFSNLSQKTSFPPLREVSRGIVQALTLGSRLAPLLREQASILRVKRMQLAEKKAAEAPLKILLPLFIFIFPTIFIVLMGPMAMMFMRGGF